MRNELLKPEAADELDSLKHEVEDELNIDVGADQSSRNNGKVGGQMVKRMIAFAENEMHDREIIPGEDNLTPPKVNN